MYCIIKLPLASIGLEFFFLFTYFGDEVWSTLPFASSLWSLCSAVPSGAGPSAAPSKDLGLGGPILLPLHLVLRQVIRRAKAFFFSSERASLKKRPQA